jgi:hypothetical protein
MTHKPTDLLARIDEALAGHDGELSVGATAVLRACRDEIAGLRVACIGLQDGRALAEALVLSHKDRIERLSDALREVWAAFERHTSLLNKDVFAEEHNRLAARAAEMAREE